MFQLDIPPQGHFVLEWWADWRADEQGVLVTCRGEVPLDDSPPPDGQPIRLSGGFMAEHTFLAPFDQTQGDSPRLWPIATNITWNCEPSSKAFRRLRGQLRQIEREAETDDMQRELPFLRRDHAMTQKKPGRRGYSDLDYALFARSYLRHVEARTRPLIPTLAEEWSISSDTASRRLRQARKRGLLTDPPTPGVPGGELTAEGLAVLRRSGYSA